MSLATRCTACGTVFRVVQDQLKVSEGWVRCGRCDAVFDAAEGLFDVDREAPPSWSPTQPPVEMPPARFDAAADEGSREHEPYGVSADEVAFAEGPAAALGTVEAARPAFPGPRGLHATGFEPADDETPPAAPASSPLGLPTASAFAPPTDPDALATPPGVGWHPDAERRLRGRRGRAWLAGAALLLVLALAAQAAAQFGEIAAARWPGVQPALARWCGLAGCSTAAPRRIQDIVVDSSALAPVIGTEALKLGIALRNRADFAVALPSVELSLTDSAGQLIARRTLQPADFQVAAPALTASGELALQALLTAGTATVTGYTVEIFYP